MLNISLFMHVKDIFLPKKLLHAFTKRRVFEFEELFYTFIKK